MEEEQIKRKKVGKHSAGKEKIKKQKGKKGRIIKIILIVILVIIIALGIVAGTFINGKLSKINFQDLDENDLGTNDDIYSEIEGLTKKEYDQVINIMLLGSDSKDMSDTYGGNSDAMMIISVNPKYSLNLVVAIVSETKLFVPVKILSFAIFRHPVITANFSAELSFNASLNIAFITSNISL